MKLQTAKRGVRQSKMRGSFLLCQCRSQTLGIVPFTGMLAAVPNPNNLTCKGFPPAGFAAFALSINSETCHSVL